MGLSIQQFGPSLSGKNRVIALSIAQTVPAGMSSVGLSLHHVGSTRHAASQLTPTQCDHDSMVPGAQWLRLGKGL
jgi:hypothetical protein